MRSIAAQWRRPGGRRQPIADAAVAAIVAAGGLILAGTATAEPGSAPSATAAADPSTADPSAAADGAREGAEPPPR
ncbi:hypothetical protein ACG5V6_04260 [Streptomyces chitinivorans]|uniref:Uncharacterized protein n=1 Tax=Streptomyces chitinivorans TaxID=1257027 RepID=A0ABW7HNI8_9ACTN|nr:hypothetical protein [Streptomyces chitinivorans]MDH2409479.1 hypothetical protein [Streptomyces chitinivorans]